MKNHSMFLKRLIIVILLITQMLTHTSCMGNRKQIQKLFLVVAMGVDLNPKGKFEVTMQVLNPTTSSTQSAGGSTSTIGSEVLIYSAVGDDFYDAVMELSKSMGRVHHFGHLKYIVIGDILARGEQRFLADSFFRQAEIRLNTPLLVTRGRASEIVSARTSESLIPADVVSDLLDRQEIIGFRPYTYLIDVVNALGSKTTDPVLAVIDLIKPEDRHGSETFRLAGSAVFKEGKLIGYLNDKETRGYNWIRGTVELGNISVTCPTLGKVSLEILSSSSKIEPIVNGNNVILNIKISTSLVIRGMGASSDPVEEPKFLDEVNNAANKAVEAEVKLALIAARDKLDADIFSFGEKVHASYSKEWASMEKDWDSIYQDTAINVAVNSKVRATGSILKSIK